jgi:putative heme-binding domain-containing protein
VAEVQGTTGLVVRWHLLGPVHPDEATALAARAGWSGPAFDPLPGDASRWRTFFAAGTEARVSVSGDGAVEASSGCLAVADITLEDPATVQLLASSNGTLRVWIDDQIIYHRPEPRSFQPDSDRVQVDLAAGSHRLAVQVVTSARLPEFHLRFRRMGSSLDHEQLIQLALTRPGNPERGRRILDDVERSLCLKCHRVGDRGERIGPELTSLGGRFARITIVESILEPSRSVAPGYESVTLALTDGRVLSGVRTAETDRTLTLGDQEGRRYEIPKADIESLSRQPRSTMPDGLEKHLTADEFVDLVAYLAAQK